MSFSLWITGKAGYNRVFLPMIFPEKSIVSDFHWNDKLTLLVNWDESRDEKTLSACGSVSPPVEVKNTIFHNSAILFVGKSVRNCTFVNSLIIANSDQFETGIYHDCIFLDCSFAIDSKTFIEEVGSFIGQEHIAKWVERRLAIRYNVFVGCQYAIEQYARNASNIRED